MADDARPARLVTAGTVGRTHGLDGSVRVLRPQHGLTVGTRVWVGDVLRPVVARRGSNEDPIVRMEGIESREAAAELRGELLLVGDTDLPLDADEWLAEDLIGCEVAGSGPSSESEAIGTVQRVIDGASCDLLELQDGTLVPLVHDAVRSVDLEAQRVEVDLAFLGLARDPS